MTRSYDGTSTPRLADFGGEVWMLAAARAAAIEGAIRRREHRGWVPDQYFPRTPRDEAMARLERVAERDA